MATVRGVYELLKKKKAAGENIGMFGESLIEAVEKEQERIRYNRETYEREKKYIR